MIVCPNCNHQNPDGAVQCEACYTPLPAMTQCPNCGTTVQADASFCGQCGFNLKTLEAGSQIATAVSSPMSADANSLPDLLTIEPLVLPDPLVAPPPPTLIEETVAEPTLTPLVPSIASTLVSSTTQLQNQSGRLLHLQTNVVIELPQGLPVVHIGKPNDRIPPDIDVSGFPNSEIVSRIHADIRADSDAYYIEDVGSSNGTYVNNVPLQLGNRHRLRPGDRIALGKGDKVSFLFQMS
ncbi:MAG: FHA domain-containing protein [Phormidesmis sp. CAN_BIN36]|nr:FHA domain-containing protein [Phormidesmis sp. CAN_BIN36]